jgi:Predicted membrane protein (DUF2254)
VSISPIRVLKSQVISYFYSFRDSFLYYPVIFSIGALVLFLLTSRLDESFGRSFYADSNAVTSYLEPLIFAGSPNAARSILSTIATGWATILGVAFSVTLITLQLAVTRYVSELINEFQNSRTNQLTLALYVLTVIYSLLVLKTVRTGEDEVPTFTPILGVNLSVYLAAIALFVFVLFLNNITSYLKPNLLIERIVGKVYRSIELYKNRVPDRRFIFGDNYQKIKRTKILEIRSPNSGIIRSLDWEKMSDHMRKHNKFHKLEQKEPLFLLEWLTQVGHKVKEKEVIAIIYSYGELPPEMTEYKEKIQEDTESMLQEAISSGVKIGPNRSISSDPHYGLEIIRNLAIKATNQSDIATITSSITGLFSILYRATQQGQLTGTPFMIPLTYNRNKNLDNRFLVTTDSGEREIAEGVLSELSIIYHVSGKSQECAISVAEHFATSYVGMSRELLGESKIKDFGRITEWYAKQTSLAISSQPLEFRHRLADILEQFRKEIAYSHPYATDTFLIHLNKILTSEA